MNTSIARGLSVLGLVGVTALVPAALAPTALAHSGSHADSASAAHDRSASTDLVADVRTAIDDFRDVDAALAAGYIPVSGCESSEQGGMGIHYLNPAIAASGQHDPLRPTILLYAPTADGGRQLLGAEYWEANVGQPRPHVGGQPFDGPMDGHGPDMPEHYDLHIWTHVANPAGVFSPWNPRVSC